MSNHVLPGAALALLPAGVSLLSPEDAVWDAMLRGWASQQGARMNKASTIAKRARAVQRYQEFTGEYPWQWRPQDMEDWITHVRAGGARAFSTVRGYQNAIEMFCAYLTHPAYGWGEECLTRFGDHPIQICHEWNTVRHVHDYEGRPEARPFSRDELQTFFDYADDQVDSALRLRRKGWVAAYRDATLFKTIYAFGLRRTEAVKLDVGDFYRNAKATEMREFGVCSVRWGKSTKGGPPKRRTVMTVFPWSVDVLEQYMLEVRPRYESHVPALFPTERGGRIAASYVNKRFSEYREEAGLPEELHPHCLRHSYVTHLTEDGWDPRFVQEQVGHVYASTTAIYTAVSNDFKNTSLRNALDRALAPQEELA